MAGLAQCMRGLVDGGPMRSRHHTPAIVVKAPVNGTTPLMSAAMRGSSARSSVAARTGCCYARPRRPTWLVLLSNPAATRTTRPVSILRCRRRVTRCAGLPGAGWRTLRHRHTRVRLGVDCRPNMADFRRRNISSAAICGRSTRKVSCCSVSSSRAPKVSPIASRSSPCPASASPSWGRAIWVCRSATLLSRVTHTRGDEGGARVRLRRRSQKPGGVPRNLLAGKHHRQAR
jgi:hypothetical protein